MTKRRFVLMVLSVVALSVVVFNACSSSSAAIKATWIKPVIDGDNVSITSSEVQSNKMNHFRVSAASGNLAFMAYVLDGKTYVRADVCPPCRSEQFSLQGSTLVCDTCKTVFDAKSGNGISGACVSYPKAQVPFAVSDGKLLMNGKELISAYQDTLKPGLP